MNSAAGALEELTSGSGGPTLYYDRNFARDAAKILPGECYVTSLDMVLVTVLGSCVAACLRDPTARLGGMNHFMLPETSRDESIVSKPTRYGVYAMELLINDILSRGGRRERLEAKVVGGGNVLKGFGAGTVGERNASFVMRFLQTEGIRVVAHDLLNLYARKVYYFPTTGRLLVKELRSLKNDTLIRREQQYRQKLAGAGAGQVELFR